jgi:hypothetical protein
VVPPTEAVPYVPRVDGPPVEGEVYTAIGYGATDDTGVGAGQRRILTGLTVQGVGEMTSGGLDPIRTQEEQEWSGDHGICSGDSGGPALSRHLEVLGAVSRGTAGCNAPVYTRVDSFAELIRRTAAEAAVDGDYPAPFWVQPNAPGSVAPAGACLSAMDCQDPTNQCLYPSAGATQRRCLPPDCAHCPAGFACGSTGETMACLPTTLPGDGGQRTEAGADAGAGPGLDAAVFVRPALQAQGGCSAGASGRGGARGALCAVAAVAAALRVRRRTKRQSLRVHKRA